MLTKRTPRRKCTDHTRDWKGFCVDKNLQDHWLERLNSLEAFNLMSICEGHCNHRAKPTHTPPHVKLRLKERFLSDVAIYWNEQKMVIVSKVNELFQTSGTYVNLELKFKLRLGTGRLDYQENLIVRIHRRRVRTSEEMDTETHNWFEQTVSQIETLDHHITLLWRNTN